mmetsp:Transcript_14053/g.36218  ORF Transcript_14053/g.36218 Transcript_14053/m.36218 type:complete len:241 (-) Transcript_14053:741-1463(-)
MSIHSVPLPRNPALHVHVNDPAVSTHVAVSAQLCVLFDAHSLILAHVRPFPVNPTLHSQLFEFGSHAVHVSPSPKNPALHAHVYDPTLFVHVEPVRAHVFSDATAHSLMSAHDTSALPVNPVLHVQLVENCAQAVHSTPLPKNPALHSHVNDASVLAHVANRLHESRSSSHSLTSAHVKPLPVYPVLHVHVKLPVVLLQVASSSHGLLPRGSTYDAGLLPQALPVHRPPSHPNWMQDKSI